MARKRSGSTKAARASSAFDALVEVRLDDRADRPVVGRIAQRGYDIFFEYDGSFLATGLEISPLGVPLRSGLYRDPDRVFAGLPGVFADSLPDGWGLRLMDRDFAKRGMNPATVTPVERLQAVGTRAMGALTYHPADDEDTPPLMLDLDELAEQAERIHAGSAEDVLPALLQAGSSPAGARPKVLVDYDPATGEMRSGAADILSGHRPYLVKFPTLEDGKDAGAVEMAYAAMARGAGVIMPKTMLFETRDGRRCFGVERFDRVVPTGEASHWERRHVHTLGGLLHASHREFGATYQHYLDAARSLTRDQRAVVQAFRRMVFNVLAHNRDDHVKNFAFLMDPDGTWRLTPAYDLTYTDGPNGEHSMMIGTEGARPTMANFLAVGAAASIPVADVQVVVDEVAGAVGHWATHAAAFDIRSATRRRIGAAIARARDDALTR
ncbi:type II toxin-antitoxin system HipA family toxin [soil metagenome]